MKVVLPVALTWAAFAWYFGPALDHELASAGEPPIVKHTSSADVVQGKSAVWWARRAIQNGKNSRARGRTVRRLQHAQLRASSHFFSWLAAADCVHNHEGAWTSATGNGYYGGMQADTSFQRAYAPDLIARYGGWAHTWPWYAQLQMAYRGWLFRGWAPWPATSRMCGLR